MDARDGIGLVMVAIVLCVVAWVAREIVRAFREHGERIRAGAESVAVLAPSPLEREAEAVPPSERRTVELPRQVPQAPVSEVRRRGPSCPERVARFEALPRRAQMRLRAGAGNLRDEERIPCPGCRADAREACDVAGARETLPIGGAA